MAVGHWQLKLQFDFERTASTICICISFISRAMHVHDSLNLRHYALLEEQVRRARSDDGRLLTYKSFLKQIQNFRLFYLN